MLEFLPPTDHAADEAASAYPSPHAEARFSLSGLIFADAVHYDLGGADASETDIRLAEIVATGRAGRVDFVAGYDFARDGEWRDVGLRTAGGAFHFALGQFKEPASLTKYTPQGGDRRHGSEPVRIGLRHRAPGRPVRPL
jgi:hypothetical protein